MNDAYELPNDAYDSLHDAYDVLFDHTMPYVIPMNLYATRAISY